MLDQSWLNEALGLDDQLPETPSISAVVQSFLDNEAGFSREDVAGYINHALQIEAADLWQVNLDGRAASLAWRDLARTRRDLDPNGASESQRKGDALMQAVVNRYSHGRTDFGCAIQTAKRSSKVQLTPETCAWVVKLDHDKHLSMTMGVNVETVFGENPASVPVKPPVPDFSRDTAIDPDAPVTQPAVGRHREANAADAKKDLAASLRQYHPTENADLAKPLTAEPEVA